MRTLEQQKAYQAGWQSNGEWRCPICPTQIGKNLLGDMPFALARQHIEDKHTEEECSKLSNDTD